MTRTRAVLLFIVIAASATFAATAAGAAEADVEHGETIAKRWCASCHVVSADQKRGSTQAPPFSELAKRPGFDAARLALSLLVPHPRVQEAKTRRSRSRMPDMRMSRDEAADLAAYIASQK
jgi:mono/diheme cytochrome c family protein